MLYSKIFWGSLVVLIGLSIIANAVFKINFPFFKVFVALIIIYFGFKLLFGSFGFNFSDRESGEYNSIFGSSRVEVDMIENDMEYNSVFGQQVVDFRNAQFTGSEADIEVNAVFGQVKVYLPDNVIIKIKSSSAFGQVRNPEGGEVNFGENRSTINKGGDGNKTIFMEANAVFGSVELH